MNILILTGRFGMGHISAAESIRDEIKIIDENINVGLVDLVEFIYPKFSELIYGTFKNVAENHHWLYNTLYEVSENNKLNIDVSLNIYNKKIERLLNIYRPDLIISTLPLSSKVMANYKEVTGLDIPLVTCITDISTHKEWYNIGTDYYMVATEAIKDYLVDLGEDRKNIFVVGIPVKQAFKEDFTKKKLGNILIMGGGLGIIPDLDQLLNKLSPDYSVTVITGNNEKLYMELREKYKNIEVVGFTKQVDQYMKKADLIISKAGGITLFEAIYTRTPIFVIDPFLPQERENASFIEEYNIGRVVWNSKDFKDSLDQLLENRLELVRMGDNMKDVMDHMIKDPMEYSLKRIIRKCGYVEDSNLIEFTRSL